MLKNDIHIYKYGYCLYEYNNNKLTIKILFTINLINIVLLAN